MPIRLGRFYSFVFETLARPPGVPTNIKSDRDRQLILAKQQTIQENKKLEFEFITNNPELSNQFHYMLRRQGNTDLEILLYDNATDDLVSTADSAKYEVPSDDEIKRKFITLNQEHGYFKTNEDVIDEFIKLFKASKLIADYAEENNSDDNQVAYEHAYKMMVLFAHEKKNTFSDIETFINTHASALKNPIHDTLVLPIPDNTPPLTQLPQWKALIKTKGRSVLALFQQAPEIERVLNEKEPFIFTFDSIMAAASEAKYKNAETNPELAQLGIQFYLQEADFDKCLTIQPKRSDNLPLVSIDGATVGHAGYHLVKLPINDPRAYILGHITNCCQSIGSNSEQCVIDGITRANNGFYVLLQVKPGMKNKSAVQNPLNDDGTINYETFDIVGQGYTWLSERNNLTIDSWENRTPSTDDDVIQKILPKFAEKCFEENPSIGRVTIGLGGKTPNYYGMMTPVEHAEVMAEGYQYGDSREQVSLSLNPALLQAIENIKEKLKKKGLDVSVDIWSLQQAEWLQEFLDSEDTYISRFGKSRYDALLKKAVTNPDILQLVFLKIEEGKQLAPTIVDMLLPLNNAIYSTIFKSLYQLSRTKPSLSTLENCAHIVQSIAAKRNDKDLYSISNNIKTQLTYLAKVNLLTEDNFHLILRHGHESQEINNLIDLLSKEIDGDFGEDYEENKISLWKSIQILIKNPQNASMAHYYLQRCEEGGILSSKNLLLLAENPEHAQSIYEGLILLNRLLGPEWITDKNRARLALAAENACEYSKIIYMWYDLATPPVEITDAQLTRLAKNLGAQYFFEYAVQQLEGYSSDLMTNNNIALLAQYSKNAILLSEALVLLYKTNPDLITPNHRALLVQANDNALLFSKGLALLYNENANMIKSENLDLLVKVKNMWGFISGLESLRNANIPITQDIFDILTADCGSSADDIFSAFEKGCLDDDQSDDNITPLKILDNAIQEIKSRKNESSVIHEIDNDAPNDLFQADTPKNS